jgi:predicted metal-dependent hydrolase
MEHCKKHILKPDPTGDTIEHMANAKTVEEYVQALVDEREKVLTGRLAEASAKARREAEEFYDRLIAAWKEKTHICQYDPDNHFICPVCGDSF